MNKYVEERNSIFNKKTYVWTFLYTRVVFNSRGGGGVPPPEISRLEYPLFEFLKSKLYQLRNWCFKKTVE